MDEIGGYSVGDKVWVKHDKDSPLMGPFKVVGVTVAVVDDDIVVDGYKLRTGAGTLTFKKDVVFGNNGLLSLRLKGQDVDRNNPNYNPIR